ncbi:rod shape-determining protein MreC [Prochlorococcus marinus]|uniref:rod shape-determining protein MreC n=1 Tax=Prochlorococcus marinus TaxID=1219 RepID=UPI0022B2E0E0|nr:rod shape-determining protein MreC [Prochlorococcus marinus]
MAINQRKGVFRWWYRKGVLYWMLIFLFFLFIRVSKGAILLDVFSVISRPFWPGSGQKEWITKSMDLEQKIRLDMLEKDNHRLRSLLKLKTSSKENFISAVVISRRPNDFWQQLELSKGKNAGISKGDVVLGPGGLLGLIDSVTPLTSRVMLITAPSSNLGVWIERTKVHGVLEGIGTHRPQLTFLDKKPNALSGDIITTSPASTLLPPNLPVGVIQQINHDNLPSPSAFVQLLASPEAIDWVQIVKR